MTPTGAKRWVFRFRLHSKRPEMAPGLSPDVSLKRTP
ncbi:Arm DNA-binding domain-containing protein [Microbulbifer sp. SSSA002]